MTDIQSHHILQEMRTRINAIVEGSNLGIKCADYIPQNIDSFLPALITLPRNDSGWQRAAGNRVFTSVTWDLYLYLALVGTRLDSVNQFHALQFLDEFAYLFLSRPQLQHNGSALQGVAGEVTLQSVRNLSQPIEWPIGWRDGALYWGAIYQLTIPYRPTVNFNQGV